MNVPAALPKTMSLVLPDGIKRALIRMNRLQGTLERLDIVTNQDRLRLLAPRYLRRIQLAQEGQDRIGELIAGNKPLMIARLGSVEASCLRFFLEKRGAGKKSYPHAVRYACANNAGIFPVDDRSLDAFSEFFCERLHGADAMVAWLWPYEEVICNTFCPDAELVHPTCLEPFWFANPWSGRLAGKNVLVIHPFAGSILRQYTEKRPLLFASPGILPQFHLKTLQAVQSIAGSRVPFSSWFAAYRHMCDEIARIDFDICLIGAGAYGLPLAFFAKSLGKQAVQLGGLTQIFFGIKGKRWESLYGDTIATLFNEQWIRPMESEKPAGSNRVENGCYW